MKLSSLSSIASASVMLAFDLRATESGQWEEVFHSNWQEGRCRILNTSVFRVESNELISLSLTV